MTQIKEYREFWWLFRTVIVAIVLSAILHLAISYTLTGGKDLWFVICLLINSLLLVHVVRSAHRVLVDEYKLYTSGEIFQTTWMTFSGLFYGAAFGIAPFIIPFEPDDILLKSSAAFFLFSHNFLTGVCVCPLIRFYRFILLYKGKLNNGLWDRSAPGYKGHLLVFKILIVYISLICAVAVVAALNSCFNLGIYLHFFAGLCTLFLLSAYLIPRYSLISQLREKRNSRLEEIDVMIELEYTSQINMAKGGGVAEVDKLEKLKKLRAIVTENGEIGWVDQPKMKKIFGSVFLPLIPTLAKVFSIKLSTSFTDILDFFKNVLSS